MQVLYAHAHTYSQLYSEHIASLARKHSPDGRPGGGGGPSPSSSSSTLAPTSSSSSSAPENLETLLSKKSEGRLGKRGREERREGGVEGGKAKGGRKGERREGGREERKAGLVVRDEPNVTQ